MKVTLVNTRTGAECEILFVLLQRDSPGAEAEVSRGPGQPGHGGPQGRGLLQTQDGIQGLRGRRTEVGKVRSLKSVRAAEMDARFKLNKLPIIPSARTCDEVLFYL